MRILIVGIGAIGGTIAARALHAGMPICLATRSADSARGLAFSGLHVSGVGGETVARSFEVAALEEYQSAEKFDLILLATKAHDALEIAPFLMKLLAPDGTLLPIQNGGVCQMLADLLGGHAVLGGFSNLGAIMVQSGVYEQRNDGHLLIGELAGGTSDRVAEIAHALSGAVNVRTTTNLRGAVWSKLLVNCAVTTIGAVSGLTMRQFIEYKAGKEVFERVYREALSVALGTGVQLERLTFDPVPPDGRADPLSEREYQAWVDGIIAFYGDIKPSMLQDIERGRKTEIDFINGYVARLGQEVGLPVSMNATATQLVHRIESGHIRPSLEQLDVLSWSF